MLSEVLKFYNYTFDEYVNSLELIKSKETLNVKLNVDVVGEKYYTYINDLIPLDVEKLARTKCIDTFDALLLTIVKINPSIIELDNSSPKELEMILEKLGYVIKRKDDVYASNRI